MWLRCKGLAACGLVAAIKKTSLGTLCVCLSAVVPLVAQVSLPVHESASLQRLVTTEEGRSIVNAALEQEPPSTGMSDCSHLVHQIYANAGFEYPYASSFEIYAGTENFVRVKTPRAGDVIAWPGHVGIVVDRLQHSFYSLVRTGLEAQDYEAPYWKLRGKPRFYRYKVELVRTVTAANTAGPDTIPNNHRQHSEGTDVEERTTAKNRSSNRPPAAASEKSEAIYGPPAAPVSSTSNKAEAAPELPARVIVATGNRLPTREEVTEGISELSDARGSVFESGAPLNNQLPVVIVEQFSVERMDIKSDHGWARLVVDSKVLIGGGAAQLKRRHEKVRWELRRTESGWEAIPPSNRIYVPEDVAVKNLAANLARLANSDGAAEHQPAVLRQESQLAGLLNALLASKQER